MPEFILQDRLEGTQVDAEQQKKYEEILELLLAAGYFRARIKGLRPFDKVIGGLTWSIMNRLENFLFFCESVNSLLFSCSVPLMLTLIFSSKKERSWVKKSSLEKISLKLSVK